MCSVAFVCLSVCLLVTLLKKLHIQMDCGELLWRGTGWVLKGTSD